VERGQFFEHLDQQLGRQQDHPAPATPGVAPDRQRAIAHLADALEVVDDYAVLLAQRDIEMQVSSDIEAVECSARLPLEGKRSIGFRLVHDDRNGWVFRTEVADAGGRRRQVKGPDEVRIDRDWQPHALEAYLQRLITDYLRLRDLAPGREEP
jgi:hypothetical protein